MLMVFGIGRIKKLLKLYKPQYKIEDLAIFLGAYVCLYSLLCLDFVANHIKINNKL